MKIGTPSQFTKIAESVSGQKRKSPLTLALLDLQIGQQLPVEFTDHSDKLNAVAMIMRAKKFTPGRKFVVRTTGKNVVTAYCIAA